MTQSVPDSAVAKMSVSHLLVHSQSAAVMYATDTWTTLV